MKAFVEPGEQAFVGKPLASVSDSPNLVSRLVGPIGRLLLLRQTVWQDSAMRTGKGQRDQRQERACRAM